MEMEIQEIVVRNNPRSDFGDLTELTASIKENGVLEPVLVTKKKELVAGERRLKAAQKAGHRSIPVRIINRSEEATKEIKLVENIQRKDLNPIEEGVAFQEYCKETKHSEEYLARKMGKPLDYVKRRLILANLPQTIKKALIENKIQIGHALLLARFDEKNAQGFLKKISDEALSVQGAKSSLSHSYCSFSKSIREAPFDKTGCKGCKFNGSEQAELFETGKTLDGQCLHPPCYEKKLRVFIRAKKKQYKNVLWQPESSWQTPRGFADGRWGELSEKAKQKLRDKNDSKSYLVSVGDRGEIKEYFKPEPTKKEKDEKEIALSRETKLKNNIQIWKWKEMVMIGRQLTRVGTYQVKALCLWHLLRNFQGESGVKETFREVFKMPLHGRKSLKVLFQADEEKLNTMYAAIAQNCFPTLEDSGTLELAAESFGLDWKKHFKLTEEFLKPFTKEKLIDLGRELKISLNPSSKRKEMVKEFLRKENLKAIKGKVPRVLK